ncbi:methylaspartate ammonia-lyase [Chelatococcus sp. GCM10030263]|uniref:methylaspartate ammonia-lyase n=1 Tax=Chelatococcus sp. GCM10030263 TaxID=3273387 RepID=UPI003619AB11
MKIADVLFAKGSAGHFHIDAAALRKGAVADGFFWRGEPVTPGFSRIVQPSECLSIILLLDDGQVAFGDCVDVVYAGSAGREPPFVPDQHLQKLRTELRDHLAGCDAAHWQTQAMAFDQPAGRWHTAVRYGVSQALLHAASLAQRQTMAGLIADTYGLSMPTQPPALLACAGMDDEETLDRLILKQVDVLPHAFVTDDDRHLGRKGEALLAHVARIAARIGALSEPGYRPQLQFDMSGHLARVFDVPGQNLIDFLERLADAAAPFGLRIECAWLAASRDEQIDLFAELTGQMRRRGGRVKLGVDEWCNTLDDFEAFARAGAGDYLHIKMPDLGSVTNSIEAVRLCHAHNMEAFLGGSANETDQSARISAHIGLACQPEVMLARPGLGGDEGVMIARNEMARALALLPLGHGRRNSEKFQVDVRT